MNFQTRYAAKILNLGGVISNPTDTVQGLTYTNLNANFQCTPLNHGLHRPRADSLPLVV
jgi:tRNA A37 threonylcarbamoyladenosine synthetase subunit TsaC/SUA5/YrdC